MIGFGISNGVKSLSFFVLSF